MYTPGPWVLDDIASLGAVYCSDATGSIVARTTGKGFEFAFRHEDEWRANAELIAAAPELLDALELILPLAKGYRPDGQTETARKTCDSWIEAAEAAIAKAKGNKS